MTVSKIRLKNPAAQESRSWKQTKSEKVKKTKEK